MGKVLEIYKKRRNTLKLRENGTKEKRFCITTNERTEKSIEVNG